MGFRGGFVPHLWLLGLFVVASLAWIAVYFLVKAFAGFV